MTLRRLMASIRKYSRSAGRAGGGGGHAARRTCHRRAAPGSFGKRRRADVPERIARRPAPTQWSSDELLALHEAVALMWPEGPVTVSTLRTAVAAGDLAHVRIAGRIYTTPAAVAAMTACRRSGTAQKGAGTARKEGWDAYLATLGGRSAGTRER